VLSAGWDITTKRGVVIVMKTILNFYHPPEISSDRLKTETSNFTYWLVTWNISCGMTNCPWNMVTWPLKFWETRDNILEVVKDCVGTLTLWRTCVTCFGFLRDFLLFLFLLFSWYYAQPGPVDQFWHLVCHITHFHVVTLILLPITGVKSNIKCAIFRLLY